MLMNTFLCVQLIVFCHPDFASRTAFFFFILTSYFVLGFPGGSDGKVSAHNVGDPDLIWSGRYPGDENGNPLQYSCLENPMDRGPW